MNIYIGEPIVVSDMQWPCPDGFHVPLTTEWNAIYNAGVNLWAWSSSNGTNLSTYLKLPMAGYRYHSNAVLSNRGLYGYYWSSTAAGTDNARHLNFGSSNIRPIEYYSRSDGYSVRCIQNSPTIPTSSWTKLYWTNIESWWIFWDSTDWLISISSNGSTWYTLMDKNLWATTIYNYGDALIEANCGKIYQRGNNYAFSWDANYDVSQISKSSTQVDVTGYWPWNYYESSTWITTNPRQSSASDGNNLRWWVSKWTSTKSVEVQNIYIGEYVPDFATQWPAPKWFHVPLQTEWQWLKTIMDWLGLTLWSDWRTNLHIPFAGSRSRISAEAGYQGTVGSYWSSSPYASNNYYAHSLDLGGSSIDTSCPVYRSSCLSVRCFKNSFKIPTSSWTVINGTLGSTWIFWNQTDWLISITSDWTTWYTIQDKNLGATTVYNNGDTLTANNCWYFYQWWNNYWFPWTWSVATSSTTVNASTYWPWNYYSSGTFITRSSRPYDWSNPSNDNLRWWVDWNVPVE